MLQALAVGLIAVVVLSVRWTAMRFGMALAYHESDPDIWNGETIQHSGPSLLRLGSDSAPLHRGRLYLTELRLVWSPSVPRFGPAQLAAAAASIRLTHIDEQWVKTSLIQDTLFIRADGQDYVFYFRHPSVFLLGPPTSARHWQELLNSSRDGLDALA
jgi:hypothetical protein